MIKVYVAQHPTDAHFLKGLLETQDIKCHIRGETLFSVRGEVPITEETAPSVWILDPRHLEEARAVVASYIAGLDQEEAEDRGWVCDACGEQLEGQFSSCWNCGSAR